MYTSVRVLEKLYCATINSTVQTRSKCVWSKEIAEAAYDCELEVNGFEAFLSIAETHKEMYEEKMSLLICYYGVESEDAILIGNVRNKATFFL